MIITYSLSNCFPGYFRVWLINLAVNNQIVGVLMIMIVNPDQLQIIIKYIKYKVPNLPNTIMPIMYLLLSKHILLLLACILVSQSQSELEQYENSLAENSLSQNNNNRNQADLQYCGKINKQEFVDRISKYKPNVDIQNIMVSSFPANRSLLIQSVAKNDVSKFFISIKGFEGAYILHVGILIAFGLILIIILPILLFTRCCLKCKISKCCQKPQNQNYSRFQLCMPTTFAILLMLTLIAFCALIIHTNRMFEPKYEEIKCSVVVGVDNIMNGGDQFVGLANLRDNANQFISNLSNVNNLLKSNFISQSKPFKNVSQSVNNLTSQISSLISSNTSQSLKLQYPSPLTSSSPNQTVASKFPQILGSPSSRLSLMANFSESSSVQLRQLQKLSLVADKVITQTKGINSTQILQSVSSSIRKFQPVQFNILTTIGLLQKNIFNIYRIGSYVLLGVTIFIAIWICMGLCCLAVYGQYSCRKQVNICCALLWLIGIIHFAIAIILGGGWLIAGHGCSITRNGLTSYDAFKGSIGHFISSNQNKSSDLGQFGQIVGKCLPQQKQYNYLAYKIFNPDILSSLHSLSQAVKPLKVSNQNNENDEKISLPSTDTITSNHTNLLNMIESQQLGRVLDIDDGNSVRQLKQLSRRKACMGEDSWIPSLKQQPIYIQCDASPIVNNSELIFADNTTCKDSLQFKQSSKGCVGCMDTYLILQQLSKQQLQIQQTLNERYKKCLDQGQGKAVKNLSNVWKNYYSVKRDILGDFGTKVGRLNSSIQGLNKTISETIMVPYKKITGWVNNEPFIQFPMETELNTSLNSSMALSLPISLNKSLDCRVVGRSLANTMSIFCNQGLSYLYVLRIFYIVTALLILFGLCCTICATSRYWHSARVSSYLRKNQYNVNINTINNQDIISNGRNVKIVESASTTYKRGQMQRIPDTQRKYTQVELNTQARYNKNPYPNLDTD